MLETKSRSLDGAIIIEDNVLSELLSAEPKVLAAGRGDLDVHKLSYLFLEREELDSVCAALVFPAITSRVLRERSDPGVNWRLHGGVEQRQAVRDLVDDLQVRLVLVVEVSQNQVRRRADLHILVVRVEVAIQLRAVDQGHLRFESWFQLHAPDDRDRQESEERHAHGCVARLLAQQWDVVFINELVDDVGTGLRNLAGRNAEHKVAPILDFPLFVPGEHCHERRALEYIIEEHCDAGLQAERLQSWDLSEDADGES